MPKVRGLTKKAVAAGGDRVLLGNITAGKLQAETVGGCLNAFGLTQPNVEAMWMHAPGPYLDDGRNEVCARFLGEFDQDWLLWFDSDVEFTADDVRRLWETAIRCRYPFVSGVYAGWSRRQARKFPVAFEIREPRPDDDVQPQSLLNDGTSFVAVNERDLGDVPRLVDAVGFGFVLTHRRFLRQMMDVAAIEDRWPRPFSEPMWRGSHIGEDMAFCVYAAAIGVPPLLDPAVRLVHHKTVPLTI